jgi:hypothetical protein
MSDHRELFFDTGCLLDIYHGRERIRPYFDEIMGGQVRPFLSVLTEAELWRGLRAGGFAKQPMHGDGRTPTPSPHSTPSIAGAARGQ